MQIISFSGELSHLKKKQKQHPSQQKQHNRNRTHNTEFSFHAIFVIESGLGSVEPVPGSSQTRRDGHDKNHSHGAVTANSGISFYVSCRISGPGRIG